MSVYIVVDASVAGAWTFNETFSENAAPVLKAITGKRVTALAPDRFEEELLSICRKKIRPPPHGLNLPVAECWNRFEDLLSAPIPLYLVPSRELHERAWEMSLHIPKLTIHDALYLALAERWNARLLTLDDVLASPEAAEFAEVEHLRDMAFSF